MRTNHRAQYLHLFCKLTEPVRHRPALGYELSPTFPNFLGCSGSRYEPCSKVFDYRCTCSRMFLAVLAVFPADLIRIPRCPYGVWPKLFSWSPYWVSGCLCREFRRNWNLLETNTNIHMRRQHTVDDDMKERLNRPKYIDCGPGKCGSTLVIQDGCKKAIMPREKLLGKKKWVEVSSSKKQMLARQSPLNKDNKICNRCYLKEVSLRKSSLRATETPSPFPVSPAAQKPASARLGADPTVPATETPGTALQKLLGKRKWAKLSSSKKQVLARPSPLNEDNKICSRCYMKERLNVNKIRSCQQLIQRDLAALTSIFSWARTRM